MKLFEFMAMGFCLVLAINLTGIFFLAFFNGGQAVVSVNSYGEQWFEMVFFPIVVVMGLVTMGRMWRRE